MVCPIYFEGVEKRTAYPSGEASYVQRLVRVGRKERKERKLNSKITNYVQPFGHENSEAVARKESVRRGSIPNVQKP
jgi:hypothetical protein